MAFANNIPDCMPVSQMQEDDWTHTVWRLCSRTSLNLTLWHPAANMHPTMRMRCSNLKLPFGQESETWQMPVPFLQIEAGSAITITPMCGDSSLPNPMPQQVSADVRCTF